MKNVHRAHTISGLLLAIISFVACSRPTVQLITVTSHPIITASPTSTASPTVESSPTLSPEVDITTPVTVPTLTITPSVFPTLQTMDYTTWLVGLAWSPDGTRIASGTGDVDKNISTVLIWDAETGEQLLTLDTPS